jgi:signal peptidase II
MREHYHLLESKGIIWVWVAIMVIGIDHYSKLWILHNLTYQDPLQILSILNLTLTYNTGASFGFLHTASGWQNWLLFCVQILASIFIFILLCRLPNRTRWLNIALSFILGGAIGNAFDRVMYGHVIDFLSFHFGNSYFAIFNIADSAICLGVFMLFLKWFIDGKKFKRQQIVQ